MGAIERSASYKRFLIPSSLSHFQPFIYTFKLTLWFSSTAIQMRLLHTIRSAFKFSLPLFIELIFPWSWYLFKVVNSPHKAKLSHELIAAAASYEVYCKRSSIILSYLNQLIPYQAAKAYSNHLAANGKPQTHEKAKEILYVFLMST